MPDNVVVPVEVMVPADCTTLPEAVAKVKSLAVIFAPIATIVPVPAVLLLVRLIL